MSGRRNAVMALVVTAMTAAAPTVAQDDVELAPAPTSSAPTGSAPSSDDAPDDGELTTLVLELKRRGDVEGEVVRVMNDLLPYEIGKEPDRRVLGMGDLRNLLEAEAARQLLDCTASSCLAELAGAVDADRVVYGSVEKLGRGYFVVLSEIDARTVKPVARAQRRLLDPTPDQLAAEVPSLVDELMRGAKGLADAGVLIVTADGQVEVVVAGRGVGGAPVVVEDAPAGEVDVILYFQEQQLKVSAPIAAGRVTTVNAKLNTTVGSVSPEEADEAYYNALGTGAGGMAGLAGSACCCSTCFCTGLVGELVAIPFGNPSYTYPGGQGTWGFTIGILAHMAVALAIAGVSSGALITSPFLLAPDVKNAHVIEVIPAEGEGERRTIQLDPKTGERLKGPTTPGPLSSAVRY